jgi:hypothetical protein
LPGPLWSWFLSPLPQPGRDSSVAALDVVGGVAGADGAGGAADGVAVAGAAGAAVVGADGVVVVVGAGAGGGVGAVGGFVGVGSGFFGLGVETGVAAGAAMTRFPASEGDATWRTGRAGARRTTCRLAGACRCGVTRVGGMRTTGGVGAG